MLSSAEDHYREYRMRCCGVSRSSTQRAQEERHPCRRHYELFASSARLVKEGPPHQLEKVGGPSLPVTLRPRRGHHSPHRSLAQLATGAWEVQFLLRKVTPASRTICAERTGATWSSIRRVRPQSKYSAISSSDASKRSPSTTRLLSSLTSAYLPRLSSWIERDRDLWIA